MERGIFISGRKPGPFVVGDTRETAAVLVVAGNPLTRRAETFQRREFNLTPKGPTEGSDEWTRWH
jgi:hypothetical protein